MKIATIVGARPQFIKAAMVLKEFGNYNSIESLLIHTGQHYDMNMSDIFFEELELPKPTYNLGIGSRTHGIQTGLMLQKLEEVILIEKPSMILVFGDTNSTLAGALVASKLHISVAHVESGLRSFNKRMPEEINRILTDHISDLLFIPTPSARENLIREGISQNKIVEVGDVMFDAALFYSQVSEEKSRILEVLGLEGQYILGSIHRAENTDDVSALSAIVSAFNSINEEISVVIPMHPRTKRIIEENKIRCEFKMIHPCGYLDMLQLIKNSRMIFTDSGGLQKEAYFFNKYCLTLRNETEWVELVTHGYNYVCGTDKKKIIQTFQKLKDKTDSKFDHKFYGDGNASKLIVSKIVESLNN